MYEYIYMCVCECVCVCVYRTKSLYVRQLAKLIMVYINNSLNNYQLFNGCEKVNS